MASVLIHKSYRLFYAATGQLDAVSNANNGSVLWTIAEDEPEWFAAEGIEAFRADKVADPPKSPNWSGFRKTLLCNAGYNRIFAIEPSQAMWFENSLCKPDSEIFPPEVLTLWNGLIGALDPKQQPTEKEVDSWKIIAELCEVPLRFLVDGTIALA